MMDGGAVARRRLAAEGCDIVDVGGELHPARRACRLRNRLARVRHVLRALDDSEAPFSIDTYKEACPRTNSAPFSSTTCWGLQKDPAMAETVAAAEAAIVIMHNRAHKDAAIDIVADIC